MSKKKKKVFIELANLNVGGIEVFSINLANYLVENGMEVGLITLYSGDALKHRLASAIQVHPLSGSLWVKSIRLFFLLKKEKPTTLLSHFHRLRLIAILAGVPHIFHIFHNTFTYEFKTLFLERFIKKRTTYIGVSDHVLTAAKKDLKLDGLPLVKIYHGIDLMEFPYSQKNYSGKILICIIGRLVRDKRIDDCIDIAARIPERLRGKVEFHVYGEGELLSELKEYADKKIPKPLEFSFKGITTKMNEVLRDYHILLATPERGGFELVLIEAMAMGLCVVAYDMGPISEVIGRNGPGILLENRDAERAAHEIQALIGDMERMTHLAREGRERVEKNFNLTKCLNSYLKLIENE